MKAVEFLRVHFFKYFNYDLLLKSLDIYKTISSANAKLRCTSKEKIKYI